MISLFWFLYLADIAGEQCGSLGADPGQYTGFLVQEAAKYTTILTTLPFSNKQQASNRLNYR